MVSPASMASFGGVEVGDAIPSDMKRDSDSAPFSRVATIADVKGSLLAFECQDRVFAVMFLAPASDQNDALQIANRLLKHMADDGWSEFTRSGSPNADLVEWVVKTPGDEPKRLLRSDCLRRAANASGGTCSVSLTTTSATTCPETPKDGKERYAMPAGGGSVGPHD